MKKTTLALLLSAVVATPVMAEDYSSGFDMGYLSGFIPDASRDKTGFALTAGMLSYDSKISKNIEAAGGADTVFQLGAEYTFAKGGILGLTSTSMQDVNENLNLGTAGLFAGYELDCGVRLKAGLSFVITYDEDEYGYETNVESGYSLGLGYIFGNGIFVEGSYADVETKEGVQFGNTVISAGYKF